MTTETETEIEIERAGVELLVIRVVADVDDDDYIVGEIAIAANVDGIEGEVEFDSEIEDLAKPALIAAVNAAFDYDFSDMVR